jgi:hypothetical protein
MIFVPARISTGYCGIYFFILPLICCCISVTRVALLLFVPGTQNRGFSPLPQKRRVDFNKGRRTIWSPCGSGAYFNREAAAARTRLQEMCRFISEFLSVYVDGALGGCLNTSPHVLSPLSPV